MIIIQPILSARVSFDQIPFLNMQSYPDNSYYSSSSSSTIHYSLNVTFLQCDLWQGHRSNLTDCRAFSNDKKSSRDMPIVANRYSINGWSHRHIEGQYSTDGRTCLGHCYYYNNSQMLAKFISATSSQDKYNNNNGTVRAIHIIIYHTIVTYPDVSYSKRPVDTTVNFICSRNSILT
jgi:hypothetical protein